MQKEKFPELEMELIDLSPQAYTNSQCWLLYIQSEEIHFYKQNLCRCSIKN